jgi:hypothetical protein
MNRQKIGIILFWLGIGFTIIWQGLTWGQGPIQRVHTAEELIGTAHAIWGPLFTLRIIGGGGPTLSLVGALLYADKKGSYIWLLGFLPSFSNFGMYWEPSKHISALFGLGGTIILLSYFGILWVWIRTYEKFTGAARRGRQIQLFGFSFFVVAGNLLCMYFGNPQQIALVDLPLPNPLVINFSFALGMLLLFIGHMVASKDSKEY